MMKETHSVPFCISFPSISPPYPLKLHHSSYVNTKTRLHFLFLQLADTSRLINISDMYFSFLI